MSYENLRVDVHALMMNFSSIRELDELSDDDKCLVLMAESKQKLTSDVMIELGISDESMMDSILELNQAIIKKALLLIQRRNIALKYVDVTEGSVFYSILEEELVQYKNLQKKFCNLRVADSTPVNRRIRVKNLF